MNTPLHRMAHRLLGALLVAAVAAVGPSLQIFRVNRQAYRPAADAVRHILLCFGLTVLACAVGALVLSALSAGVRETPAGRRAVLAATAAAAGILNWWQFGRMIGLWVAAGVVMGTWILTRDSPVPGIRRVTPTGQITGAVGWALLAWRGSAPSATRSIIIYAAIAVAMLLVGTYFEPQIQRVQHAIRTAVGTVLRVLLFGLLGIFLVVIPWAVSRVLGFNPVRSAGGGAGGWIEQNQNKRTDRLMFSPHRTDRTGLRPWWMRAARRIVGAAVLVALVGTTVWVGVIRPRLATTDSGFRLDRPGPEEAVGAVLVLGAVPAAVKGDMWYPKYREAFNWMMNQLTAFHPLDPLRLADVHSPYINVSGGMRKTWTPPKCACTRLTVWLYGGSTTFGLDQRDEHTIASELARAAAAKGVVLDIKNRGVLGDMNWEEANRFSWDLTVSEPPDLVVFYDGVNEIWGTQALLNANLGDWPHPMEPLTQDIWKGWLKGESQAPPEPPRGIGLTPPPRTEINTPEGAGTLAGDRYSRSRKMGRDTAAANGVPIKWFWQPTRVSRPYVPGEYGNGPEADEWSVKNYGAATAAATESGDVTDLSDVLDPYREPMFTDDVHHNEKAAKIIAGAMFASLEPSLRKLVDQKAAGG